MEWKRVVVVGAGYVGLATAAGLASGKLGCRPEAVVVWDIDPSRIRRHNLDIAEGRDPLGEPGMREALLPVHLHSSHDSDLDYWFHKTGAVICAVGTPHDTAVGGIDTSAVLQVAEVVARSPIPPPLFIVRSTIDPATAFRLHEILHPARVTLAVVPEFLREGHAIEDTFGTGRRVVGCLDPVLGRQIGAKFSLRGVPMAVITMTPPEAALVKLGSNGMLAFRAWFAGAVAAACQDWPFADAEVVLSAIGADPRIGTKHLQPSLGVGGPCLPKDSKALAELKPFHGMGFQDHLLEPCYSMANAICRWWRGLNHGIESGMPVTVLGLGFKLDSSDWRGAPILDLMQRLYSRGARVTAWDDRLVASDWPFEELFPFTEEILHDGKPVGGLQPFPGRVLILNREFTGLVRDRMLRKLDERLNYRDAPILLVDPHRQLSHAFLDGLQERGIHYLGLGRGPGWER